MSLTKLSDYRSTVEVDADQENFVTAIAEGTSKAGDVVNVTTGTGIIAQTDVNAVDLFTGILATRYDTDIDTAPTASKTVRVLLPKVGHKYIVTVVDLNASGPGIPLTFHTTAGALTVVSDVEATHICRTWRYTDGDTVAEVIWGD
jgi:hypothetical protein